MLGLRHVCAHSSQKELRLKSLDRKKTVRFEPAADSLQFEDKRFSSGRENFVKLQQSNFESAQKRSNVAMACILVQRRKAAIQEEVKKFHFCQYFPSTSCVTVLFSLFCFKPFATSGTCGTAVLFVLIIQNSLFLFMFG